MSRNPDDLYGGEPPHQEHSDTSTDAARELEEERRTTLRMAVLGYISFRREQGATDEEIQIALEMEGNTERPRRRELQLMGQVEDSGKRRLTTSGKGAVVWVCRRSEVAPVAVSVDDFLAGPLLQGRLV